MNGMIEDTEKRVSELISDKEKFREFVYTPLDKALEELHRRRLERSTIHDLQIPTPLLDSPKAVLFRHIATPNYEIRRFVSIVDGIDGLDPLILEYTKDKFTNSNEWKYSLGKIPFFKGRDSKGGLKFENISVIDFNESNGKSISSLHTRWGQPLVDLHHELFFRIFPGLKSNIFDLSDWLKENGESARHYYKPFLKIFLRNGILFENFLLEEPELTFNRNIILPNLIEIAEETGLKPLIVSLEPTETEGSRFWLCHPHEDKPFVVAKIRG